MRNAVLFIILLISCSASRAGVTLQPLDSVGVAFKNGSYFIIHEVENRQTLFALSKVYKVTTGEITAANPGMLPALQPGQLLYIPLKNFIPSQGLVLSVIEDGKLVSGKAEEEQETEKPAKEIPAETKKEKEKEEGPEPGQIEETKPDKFNWKKHDKDDDLYHTVKAGETLFRIATFYGLSVEEIKTLNGLLNNTIEVGQNLLIKKGRRTLENEKRLEKEKRDREKLEELKYKNTEKPKKDNTPKKEEEKTMPQPETAPEPGEVNETGWALVIEKEFPDADKNVALHTTAPTGTIILVTNPGNGKAIYVRVAGKLETTDKTLLLMISPEAARNLGANPEGKIKLQLSYAK